MNPDKLLFLIIGILLALPMAYSYTASQLDAKTILAWDPAALTTDDSPIGKTATLNGGVLLNNTVVKVGTYSGHFAGDTTEPLVWTSNGIYDDMINFTICYIGRSEDGTDVSETYISSRTDTPATGDFNMHVATNTNLDHFLYYTTDWIAFDPEAGTAFSRAENHMELYCYAINITGTALNIQHTINGTMFRSLASTVTWAKNTHNIVFGDNFLTAGTNRFKGWLDNIIIFNASIPSHNIRTFLWDNGNFDGYPFAAEPDTTPINITLTAVDYYDNASINNFSVRIYNGSSGKFVDWVETTGNGTIYITNLTENLLYNMTFFSNQSYMNVTYSNINVSQNSYAARMWQSIFYLNLTEVISGNKISDFAATANKRGLNFSNSTGFVTLRVRAGSYNITANSTSHFNISDVFNVNALQEKYINLSGAGTIKLTINATVVITREKILNFTIKLNKTNAPNQNYSNNITTEIGLITYYLINGTYGVNFESDNYASQFISLTLNSSDNIWNHTFQIYTTNSINFSFYDEILGKTLLLNSSPVFVKIVSNIYSTNFSTTNGTFFIDLLTPADYRVSYSTIKYKQRDYFFTLKNRSHNVLDLYLLSLTNSTDVIFEIKDESGNFLEDATLSLKRYYVDSNSYITVAMAKTNREGQSVLDVDFDDAYYQILATYGAFSTNTQGSKIFSTTITLRIDTLTDPFVHIDSINRIISNISFNNLTQTFSYYFSDPDGLARVGTLEVIVNGIVVCSNTASSSSATILCQYNTTNITSSVRAVGYIDSSKVPTAVMEIVALIARQAKDLFGSSGLFYTILFAGSVAGLGIFSIATSVIMFLVGLGAMFFMGISYVTTLIYVLIVIMGLIVIWKVRT